MDGATISGAAMDQRVARPRRRARRLLYGGGVVLAVMLGALLWGLLPGADAVAVDAAVVRTAPVGRAAFRDFVPLRAEVVPLATVYLTAVSGGQVAELIASDGQMVEAGTALVRLANPELELEVASRAAGITDQLNGISGQRLAIQRARFDAERELAEARNALAQAESTLTRQQVLFEKEIIARAAIETYRRDAAFQRERVAALRRGSGDAAQTLAEQAAGLNLNARELRDSLAMVRGGLSALTVRAPVAGRLTAFQLQPGQAIKAGDAIGQVDSIGRWKLVADVDQYFLSRIRTGLSGRALIDGRTVPITLIKLLPQVTEGRFRVELGFAGAAPAGLNRGQVLDVQLVLGADRPAVVAPSGGWLDAGGGTAFVMIGDDRAERRTINTGRRNPDQIEVVVGLAPGERIVTTPIAAYARYRTLILE